MSASGLRKSASGTHTHTRTHLRETETETHRHYLLILYGPMGLYLTDPPGWHKTDHKNKSKSSMPTTPEINDEHDSKISSNRYLRSSTQLPAPSSPSPSPSWPSLASSLKTVEGGQKAGKLSWCDRTSGQALQRVLSRGGVQLPRHRHCC